MNEQHQKTLEQHADALRFILDIVRELTDARNNDTFRENAAYDLMEREHLFAAVGECREIFRSIANQRTDNQKEPRP